MDKIIPIWQPVGYSTYQITSRVAEKFNEKAAHTGVLDPLAEGVIIVLLGDERFNKIKYAGWKKTYEFEITLGIRTDSFDGMGIISEYNHIKFFDDKTIEAVLKGMTGEYEQKVPLYSAVKVDGKKLFLYPKQGKIPPYIPSKKGEIYDIKLLNSTKIKLKEIIEENTKKLKKITGGEFRQKEIMADWNRFKKDHSPNQDLQKIRIKVEISRGMYVRSLSQDICKKLDTIGFVSELIRTKNGKYNKKDCEKLKNIFGFTINFKDFTSKFSLGKAGN
jgi:tRNA pseudouridine(55) synthase